MHRWVFWFMVVATTDALDRLSEDHLNEVEADVSRIRSHLRSRGSSSRRAVIHCHSHLSHDSEGSIGEIARAARKTGTEIVMMTDHRRQDLDVIGEGFSGRKSGVMFLPGAEVKRLLIFLADGLDFDQDQQELINDVRDGSGLAFLSHLEDQKHWNLLGLTGTEIYNFHACFKAQQRLRGLLEPRGGEDLMRLLGVLQVLDEHPESGFASFGETPVEYLERWDHLSSDGIVTGIAANDSHANSGITIEGRSGGRIMVSDFRGNLIADVPSPRDLPEGEKSEYRPDSYEVSLGHVGTHLLMHGGEIEDLVECLASGSCFVGFDWIADTSGFSFSWETDRASGGMGSTVSLRNRPMILADLPHPSNILLKSNGSVRSSCQSDHLEYEPSVPGNYRLEAYLTLAGEKRPWILGNPIRVVA